MKLTDIVQRFDGFILDQFGVLHDGTTLYPGALAALEALKKAEKPVVLLTNSGKSAASNAQRLAKFGINPGHYAHIVSSGEAARLTIEDGSLGDVFCPGAAVGVQEAVTG